MLILLMWLGEGRGSRGKMLILLMSRINYLIYFSRAWNFVFRKLEFNMICYAYSNESPFKHFRGYRGSEAMLIFLI